MDCSEVIRELVSTLDSGSRSALAGTALGAIISRLEMADSEKASRTCHLQSADDLDGIDLEH